jgi:hypothetical protein
MRLDASELAVLIGGIVLIVLILWYFFGDRASLARPADPPQR